MVKSKRGHFMKKLENKIVAITGATGGIGLATSTLFLQEGAKVVLIDKDQNALKEAEESLSSKNANFFQADVTSKSEMEDAISYTENQFGRLDIAFLNAGVEGPVKSIFDYTSEEFEKVMAINVKGVFLGLKVCATSMMKHHKGSIIITSSLAGLRGMPKISGYVASKHAVVGLMKAAALELASVNIRVNTINPAPIATRMISALEKDFAGENVEKIREKFEQAIPLRRYGQPSEVAKLALFLASEDSSFITGNTYPIDGGSSAK